MKHPAWYFVGFLMVLVPLLPASVGHAGERTVLISSDPWEPWVIGADGEKATKGFGVTLAREVFRRVGVLPDIEIFPYARCLQQMKKGTRDVLLLAKKTPERETFMVYSDVAARDPQLLYSVKERAAEFHWETWADLKRLVIGGVRGFNYGALEEHSKPNDYVIKPLVNDRKSVEMLLAGRLDLVALNRSTADYLQKVHPEFEGRIEPVGKVLSDGEFYFALSKKGAAVDLLEGINKALRSMKEDGSWEKILRGQRG